MAAFWIAMNWPESKLSFTSPKACTIRSWPQTQPMRQPIMSKAFDIEWISTPTSRAPGIARKLQRLAVVAEDGVGGVLDDDDVVLLGEGDHPFVELGRGDAAGGAVGVAEDEQLGSGADVGGDAVEIGEEIVFGGEREFVDDAAVVAGVGAGDGIAGDGHQRDVARVDEAGGEHREGGLRADAVADFGRRIERRRRTRAA